MEYEVFTKEPYEEFDIGFDFNRMMSPGATIISLSVAKATRMSDNVDVTASSLTNSTFVDTIVATRVKGGVSGDRVKIEFRIADSNGEKHENGLICEVTER